LRQDASAIRIQSAARNRKALNELKKREDRRDKFKNLINSGEIQEAFNRRENRRIKATMIQSAGRIHFFLEISKFFQKVMTFFEKMYPVFKKFFKNVLEKPKPFGEAPRKS
jgi:hypothetical protein